MKINFRISKERKLFAYALFKTILSSIFYFSAMIAIGYLIVFMGFIDDLGFPYVVTTLLMAAFDLGMNVQKIIFNFKSN